MKRSILICIAAIMYCGAYAQPQISRPKLVVGIVVDQMRWDYLYRYYNRFSNDGFKRLLSDGFNCQNTMLSYIPSYTAPGHSCIYTGSVPSIHGIAGNNWIDNQSGKIWYCVDDTAVNTVGDIKKAPSMSPRNLLVTTITDELRLATNFSSRVYGIALKDRGAILPAGHTANGAYWYNDKTGDFITSTYYDKQYQSPQWLQAFNKRRVADSLTATDWELLYDKTSYTQSTADSTAYEGTFKGEASPIFPHRITQMGKPERLSALKTIPAGNTLTLMMAKACIENAEGGTLGSGKATDFLCVSLSSTDYAGHQYAPNSIEVEDTYLRLDRELADFLNYLDRTVGKGNYLIFLTADHGGAHNARFLEDNKIPAGALLNFLPALNAHLKKQFGKSGIADTLLNYQVFLNESMIAGDRSLNREEIKNAVYNWLLNVMPIQYKVPVSYVIDMDHMDRTPVPEPIRTMAINGYHRTRSGSLLIIPAPGWYEAEKPTGTTHGTWNPYDTHIPLLWYGWHIPQGETNRTVSMTDITATLAALLHVQMPNGCVGNVINEITK